MALWVWLTHSKRVVLGDAGDAVADLAFMAGLMARGELVAVIDRRYALQHIQDAHRYVQTGHKQGHVVIEVT